MFKPIHILSVILILLLATALSVGPRQLARGQRALPTIGAKTYRGAGDSRASHDSVAQTIDEINLPRMPLDEAIERLRQLTRLNLVVDWIELKTAGVRRDAPVELHLWDTDASRVIQILFMLAGADGPIALDARDGIVFATTRSDAGDPRPSAVRVYDIRDLTQLAGGNGGQIVWAAPRGIPAGPTYQERIEALVHLIESSVETDSWKDNGGGGSLYEFAGRLVVMQTPKNHRLLANFLRTLRAGGSKYGSDIRDASAAEPPDPREQQ